MDAVKKRHWWQSPQLTWSVIGLLCLLVGYLVVLMYAQGEYLFAIMTLILSSVGLYIFANRKAYAWRYVYPGLAGMGLVVVKFFWTRRSDGRVMHRRATGRQG
ncbi:hypothetical protein ACQV32_25610, partial [Klebsiella pneumoniae]